MKLEGICSRKLENLTSSHKDSSSKISQILRVGGTSKFNRKDT